MAETFLKMIQTDIYFKYNYWYISTLTTELRPPKIS